MCPETHTSFINSISVFSVSRPSATLAITEPILRQRFGGNPHVGLHCDWYRYDNIKIIKTQNVPIVMDYTKYIYKRVANQMQLGLMWLNKQAF